MVSAKAEPSYKKRKAKLAYGLAIGEFLVGARMVDLAALMVMTLTSLVALMR